MLQPQQTNGDATEKQPQEVYFKTPNAIYYN